MFSVVIGYSTVLADAKQNYPGLNDQTALYNNLLRLETIQKYSSKAREASKVIQLKINMTRTLLTLHNVRNN